MANTCCPKGLIYIDSNDDWVDPGFVSGAGLAISSGKLIPTQWGLFNSMCVNLVNVDSMGNAYADPRSVGDPIPCLCCPPTMTYSSYDGQCYCYKDPACTSIVPKPPIPCVSCVCPPEEPEPEPVCETCSDPNPTTHTSFTFNPTIKNCTDCNPQGEPQLTNDPKFNAFLPDFLIDPVINFRLDV